MSATADAIAFANLIPRYDVPRGAVGADFYFRLSDLLGCFAYA
jgi:hypothetical protein